MLIATFGPTTAWNGLRITFEEGAFVLEGHGVVTATDVMEYDRQGHLKWADEGTRAWVGSKEAVATPAVSPDAERGALLKRILLLAIITLLVVNLVLLVVTAHVVHVLP
jgi:hypothetical protein